MRLRQDLRQRHLLMCKIFGAVGYEMAPTALERVLQSLMHRGPDGRGIFLESVAQLTLVRTRLPVIDLATGAQRSSRGIAGVFQARERPCPRILRSRSSTVVQEARLARMPFDILCFLGDRDEIAHSLEPRLPFVDHHLFDVARRIPVDVKFQRGMEKAVLRDAAKGLLPNNIRLRRKSGFMMTDDAVDFGRLDRARLEKLHPYLSRPKFRTVQIFSCRSFPVLGWMTRLPPLSRSLRRIREAANKIIMYMLHVHMLHDMFIERPRWNEGKGSSIATQRRSYEMVR